MTTTPTKAERRPWQPLSPKGVAAFANAPVGRLLLVQVVFAVLAAGSIGLCLRLDWYPAIAEAIQHLPEQGEIRTGQLVWTKTSPQLLAADGFLALAVDLDHQGTARSPSDVQIEFGRHDFWIISLFGYSVWTYPKGWIIAFNRTELEPWWGAWGPPLLWILMGAVVLALLVCWAILALVYSWLVRFVGFFADRTFNPRESWKLAGAALMPGALFLSVAIASYGLGVLNQVALVGAAAAHLAVGWFYLLTSPFFSRKARVAPSGKGNPFARR